MSQATHDDADRDQERRFVLYDVGALDEGGVPSIALEVEVTSRLVDKMAVYAGLGIAEVWSWLPKTRTLLVQRLAGADYERCPRSEILPDLDLALLARFVR